MAKVLVLYYSAYGHIETMAYAVAEGAMSAGAEVTVKRVPELVPEEVAKSSHFKLDQAAPIATVDELAEYITLNAGPARFSPSRTFRRPLLKRLFQPAAPLESGFVLSKREAQSAARAGMSLAELTQGIKTRRLTCEMIPAWAMRGR